MSLEKFRRSRMVVLTRRSMAYQAARAMEDNHIGSVLVADQGEPVGILTDRDLALGVIGGDLDPNLCTLGEVMSEGIITCDIGQTLSEVARLMKENAIRRIPVTENGRLAGLITFDDLVLDGSVGTDVLRSIVTAQLEVEAPQKPAGLLHPQAPAAAAGRAHALVRAHARAEAAYNRLIGLVSDATGLDRERSERSLLLAVCMLCRRLVPDEAQHLIAQLPSKMRPQLDQCLDGPDRAVTEGAIRDALGNALGLDAEEASDALRGVCSALSGIVAPGQINDVRGQLPEEMKHLFPQP